MSHREIKKYIFFNKNYKHKTSFRCSAYLLIGADKIQLVYRIHLLMNTILLYLCYIKFVFIEQQTQHHTYSYPEYDWSLTQV